MFKLEINIPTVALVYAKKELRKALRQVGALVARNARGLIRGAKQSVPGSPPVSRTGALAASIKLKPSKSGDSVAVRDSQFYALFLEKGAVGGGNRNKRKGRSKQGRVATKRVLEPRPFLSAALDQTQAIIEAKLKASIQHDIKMVKK